MRADQAAALLTAVCLGAGAAEPPRWAMHVIDGEGQGADGIRLMDVNGDGRADAACGWEERGVTRVYLHPGPGKAAGPWPKVEVGKTPHVEDAVFVDLDGDGAADVVSSLETGGEAVMIHWAPADAGRRMDPAAWSGAALEASRGSRWMFCVPLQLDAQYGPDLVVGGKSADLVWFEAPADPRDPAGWRRHVISSAARDCWTMSLHAADMDGDGDPDILWTSRQGRSGGVRWVENPGPEAAARQPWRAHALNSQPADFMFAAVGDLDGDGRQDVVAPIQQGGLVFFRRTDERGGTWEEHRIACAVGPRVSPRLTGAPRPGVSGAVKAVGIGDLDLDGKMDLAVTFEYQSEEAIWLSFDKTPAETNWTRHVISDRRGKCDLVQLDDVDGDGDTDLLTTVESGPQVVWYENPAK